MHMSVDLCKIACHGVCLCSPVYISIIYNTVYYLEDTVSELFGRGYPISASTLQSI